MNNISEFMNKIDIRSSGEVGLLLESLGVVTLGSFWNGITLSGDYWRFYYHDAPGAGVMLNGCKKEFLPHRAYLLPPACNLESFCISTPEQFFIHAELNGCRSSASENIWELPENFGSAIVAEIRAAVVAGQAHTANVRLKALALMTEALSQLPESILSAPELDSRVAAARDYINTRLNEDIDLDTIARQAKMAPESFLRLFKKECAITPYQYLLQQRYNCAARLLKNSNLPIEDICDAVGIRDRFHFSRQFKKLFGMPPAAYRQTYRAG